MVGHVDRWIRIPIKFGIGTRTRLASGVVRAEEGPSIAPAYASRETNSPYIDEISRDSREGGGVVERKAAL